MKKTDENKGCAPMSPKRSAQRTSSRWQKSEIIINSKSARFSGILKLLA